jgi:hypothetical protein
MPSDLLARDAILGTPLRSAVRAVRLRTTPPALLGLETPTRAGIREALRYEAESSTGP